jgi:ABC-type transport system involved in multi-copper enzyme maturation permease subunit
MWYKEWLSVRIKFLMFLTIFGTLAVLFATAFAPNTIYNGLDNGSIFMRWIGVAFLLAVGAGILGGVDIIASEREQNTITFLLARPINRFKIYASKLGINALTLLMVFLPVNLLMLLVDNLPRQLAIMKTTSVLGVVGCSGAVNLTQTGTVAATITPANIGLPLIIVGALLGVTVMCITGLTSIFASNIVHGMLLSLIGISVSLWIFSTVGTRLTGNYFSAYNLTEVGSARSNIMLLIVYSLIVFGAGAFLFRRKEF